MDDSSLMVIGLIVTTVILLCVLTFVCLYVAVLTKSRRSDPIKENKRQPVDRGFWSVASIRRIAPGPGQRIRYSSLHRIRALMNSREK